MFNHGHVVMVLFRKQVLYFNLKASNALLYHVLLSV